MWHIRFELKLYEVELQLHVRHSSECIPDLLVGFMSDHETIEVPYKEGVAGSNPASPT